LGRGQGIEISVVICTRNRARQLHACLERFERQRTTVRWELLIVDNASTDDTRAVADAFIEGLDVPAGTLFEGARGNGAGRNAALPWARGTVIGFTDDDCYVADDYVEQLARTFREHPVDYIAGRILLFDPDDAPVTIAESTIPFDVPGNRPVPGAFVQAPIWPSAVSLCCVRGGSTRCSALAHALQGRTGKLPCG
jgi:Glycosyltransferases involved in cell wall biogenesis